MADAQTRKAAIKLASYQVRTGGAFVRRAPAVKAVPTAKVPPAPRKAD
jgi:hypothetical protein